jgi:hypothetical protein
VELAIWEALDNPNLLKVLLALLWLWGSIDAKWLADASFMSVRDVRDHAESEPILVFPCLGCGTELAVRNRWHQMRMLRSAEDYCQDAAANDPPPSCSVRPAKSSGTTTPNGRLAWIMRGTRPC